jgi:hypothetical protein
VQQRYGDNEPSGAHVLGSMLGMALVKRRR